MSRRSLALLLALTSPVLAQQPTEPAQAEPPAAAPPAAAPAPAPAAPAPAAPAQAAPAPAAPAQAAPAPAAPAQAAPAPAAPAAPTGAAPQAAPPKAPPPPAAPPVAPRPAPAPAAPPAAQAPAAQPPAAAPPKNDAEAAARSHVRSLARYLFQSLVLGDARSVSSELIYPFQLEDKRYGSADELVAAWVKELRSKRTDLVTLYDVEVLSFAELEKKYGKAPARLGLNLAGAQGYAAVGNLSGHAAIFLFRQTPEGWRAFAYTD